MLGVPSDWIHVRPQPTRDIVVDFYIAPTSSSSSNPSAVIEVMQRAQNATTKLLNM